LEFTSNNLFAADLTGIFHVHPSQTAKLAPYSRLETFISYDAGARFAASGKTFTFPTILAATTTIGMPSTASISHAAMAIR
jgi:hypothetical protein